MAKHDVECPKCRASFEIECAPAPKKKSGTGDPMKDAFARLAAEEAKRKNATLGSMNSAVEKKRKESEDKFSEELDRLKKDKDNKPPERPFDYD